MTTLLFIQVLALYLLASTLSHMINQVMAGSIDDDLEAFGAKAESTIIRKAQDAATAATKLKVSFDAEPQSNRPERS